MSKSRRRYVAKAVAGKGWRVWDNKSNRWWGEFFKKHPEQLVSELNGRKSPEQITKLIKGLQIERRPIPKPKRIKA